MAIRTFAIAFALAAIATVASAQIVTPTAITPGEPVLGELTDSSPRLPDGGPFACYAIETSRGQRVVAIMRSEAFDSRIWIARGGACTGAAVQHDNNNYAPDTLDARVNFTAAGGRYLIIARSTPGAVGPFRLDVQGGESIEAFAADATPSDADRRRLMDRQVATRRAEVAAEAARRQQIEAARAREQARREEAARRQRAEQGAFWTGLLTGAVEVLTEYNAQMEVENRRLEAETARIVADAEYRAAEQRRQQQAQAEAARQQQAGTPGTSGGDPQARAEQQRIENERRQLEEAEARRIAEQERQAEERRQRAEAERRERERVIPMREGVVVCPTDGSRLFGESMCFGPFQNALSDIDNPRDIGMACGSSGSPVSDYGMYGRYRVWGCGYGINPTRSGSPNIDQADRYGLIVPPRRTYHCPANISGYCRN